MRVLSAALLLSVLACAHHKKEEKKEMTALPRTIEEAVANPIRTQSNLLRDQYRHPLETLTFFGVKPELTVVEIWPSGGWYTEILAPLLVTNGKYIIADPASDPKGYTNPRKEWLAKYPEISERVSHTTFQPPEQVDVAPENSVDMILTFRNVHNWLPAKTQQAAFNGFFRSLKPGGVLGVVDHRANPKKKFDPESGYVLEKDIIKLAKKAGFKLEAKSEINANPKDTADYPDGVWTLPPRLRLGEKDKDKYLAIGESDRMTLKFVKPAKK